MAVPDARLQQLTDLSSSAETIPTRMEFVDIAGLVKGASQGEGLGNKFLANIREVDAIVHVVRCFEDDDVIHVSGSVGPVRDAEVINLELGLSDLAQIEKRRERLKKQMRTSKEAQTEDAALERIQAVLEEGGAARSVELSDEEASMIKPLGLLTAKSIIYATNVSEDDLADGNAFCEEVVALAKAEGAEWDPERRTWYVPAGIELAPLSRWIPRAFTFLRTSFDDNVAVKALGARFDGRRKKWFAPGATDLRPFARWMGP